MNSAALADGFDSDTQTVYGLDGEKAGVLVREGAEWVTYNLSDVEVYRGQSALQACWTLQGR